MQPNMSVDELTHWSAPYKILGSSYLKWGFPKLGIALGLAAKMLPGARAAETAGNHFTAAVEATRDFARKKSSAKDNLNRFGRCMTKTDHVTHMVKTAADRAGLSADVVDSDTCHGFFDTRTKCKEVVAEIAGLSPSTGKSCTKTIADAYTYGTRGSDVAVTIHNLDPNSKMCTEFIKSTHDQIDACVKNTSKWAFILGTVGLVGACCLGIMKLCAESGCLDNCEAPSCSCDCECENPCECDGYDSDDEEPKRSLADRCGGFIRQIVCCGSSNETEMDELNLLEEGDDAEEEV